MANHDKPQFAEVISSNFHGRVPYNTPDLQFGNPGKQLEPKNKDVYEFLDLKNYTLRKNSDNFISVHHKYKTYYNRNATLKHNHWM